MGLILLILVLWILFGGAVWPSWGWHHYGYWPSGFVTILAIVLVVYLLRGRF